MSGGAKREKRARERAEREKVAQLCERLHMEVETVRAHLEKIAGWRDQGVDDLEAEIRQRVIAYVIAVRGAR